MSSREDELISVAGMAMTGWHPDEIAERPCPVEVGLYGRALHDAKGTSQPMRRVWREELFVSQALGGRGGQCALPCW